MTVFVFLSVCVFVLERACLRDEAIVSGQKLHFVKDSNKKELPSPRGFYLELGSNFYLFLLFVF